MDIFAYAALVIVLAYLLGKSADFIEDGFVNLARKFRISTFLIGFIVISFASSLPEVSVAVTSATNGVPGLSIGHLLGGSLIMITFVLGLNVLRHGRIPFKGSFGIFQVFVTVSVLFAQIFTLLDGELSQTEGGLLMLVYALLAIYITSIGSHRKATRSAVPLKPILWRVLIPRTVVGVIGLIIFSNLIVTAATTLASLVGIPNSIVGLLVLAIGTNTPELALSLRSKTVDQKKLVVGNMMGSAALNTGTIGLLGVLSPYEIDNATPLLPVLVLLTAALLFFGVLAHSDRELSRREGYVLISIYAAFVAVELFLISQGLHA